MSEVEKELDKLKLPLQTWQRDQLISFIQKEAMKKSMKTDWGLLVFLLLLAGVGLIAMFFLLQEAGLL